jgi:hypothetical protein
MTASPKRLVGDPGRLNSPQWRSADLLGRLLCRRGQFGSALQGGFKSRVSSGSSYVRTIVKGRASPWFEEYWTPLGSFGQAPLDGDLVYFWAAAHAAGAAGAVARRDLGAFRQEWRRVRQIYFHGKCHAVAARRGVRG